MTKYVESEIVISGISGRFPKSDNLNEFWLNLIEGKDMISDEHDRFLELGLKMPSRMGIVNSLDKFDADFFAIHSKQAITLEPRIRKLLEVSHEAIMDAGLSPVSIHGSNTGVFVATCDSEAAAISHRSFTKHNAYAVLGSSTSMLANRISFFYDLHGPSFVLDTACSSSGVAIHQAMQAIQTEVCDAAIVAGARLHHDAIAGYMFYALDMTSTDGKCKVFDAAADGYARAEAVVAVYICKKEVAKRAYATIVHVGINNDGYKDEGVTYPSNIMQEKVIRKVYKDIGLDPLEVDYFEAHGTGTKVGDPEEMSAITRVFCEGRKGALPIGSVKSNMGHSEPVCSLCSIAKLILSHIARTIPANLHYHTPNPGIPALFDGRVKVVDTNQPFDARYVAINSLGFGGTNVHLLMKFDNKQNNESQWRPSTPVIIAGSGRTEEAVRYFLENALQHKQDQHFVKLLHELSAEAIPRHPYRGYVVANVNNFETIVEKMEPKDALWFIFSGMGSQWPGMTKDLIKFEEFKKSITTSAKYLSSVGFDLKKLLKSGDKSMFEDLKNAMVAITATQIALVDLLTSMGLEPDGIIGHSTGEVAAGYADGCLSHKQTVLTSLARARSFLESDLPPGAVASVGLTWDEAHKRCPKGIYPAIYNGKENVTIAGPPELINTFMEQLQSEGIFVKAVRSAIHGYHSPLVQNSKPTVEKLLREIIPDRTPRSSKWLSSSVPEQFWDSERAKYSSYEYYTNNGLNPVYLYPALLHVPERSIAMEIAPHCFMLSILKQSLPNSCVSFGLIHVKSPDNCQYFLNSIGQCYLNGIKINMGSLYGPVRFPVNSRTPTISPLIKWDYGETWYTPHNRQEFNKHKGARFDIDLSNPGDSFYEGHCIEGKIIFPATGYLLLVWKFFSSQIHLEVDQCPVVFQNVRFERLTFLNSETHSTFIVNILQGSGKFEILESDVVVCTGEIRQLLGGVKKEVSTAAFSSEISQSEPRLTKDDFYKELHLRGYNYSGLFQGIQESGIEGNWGKVDWTGDWVSFLDCILQLHILQNENRTLFVPTRIKKIIIDPSEVKTNLQEQNNIITVNVSRYHETAGFPGFELRGLNFANFSSKSQLCDPITTEHVFVSYCSSESTTISKEIALQSIVEIVVENSEGAKFEFTEILSNLHNSVTAQVKDSCTFSFSTCELTTVNVSNARTDDLEFVKNGSKIISLQELAFNPSNHFVYTDCESHFMEFEALLISGGFLLFKCADTLLDLFRGYEIISKNRFLEKGFEQTFVLLRKISINTGRSTVISTDDNDFKWVESAKKIIRNSQVQQVVFASQNPSSGINGFVKCLVKELRNVKIQCFHAIDPIELNFDKPSIYLQQQVNKNLLYNIFKCGSWGYFSNILIPVEQFRMKNVFKCVYANILRFGDLSSLSWSESLLRISNQEMVEVYYSSLNFRDIMLASGQLNQASVGSVRQEDCVLGLEFSGYLKGKRVFGFGDSKCLATHIDPTNLTIFDVVPQWTHKEAVTVPAVYITVYLALIVRGRLKPGETILVHAGAGGIGQAAITIALSMNCKVFTTVSTIEKTNFLKNRFPSLTDENFSNSRNPNEFRFHIQTHTKGRGVNLVLNSLSQDSLKASIDCLSRHGRFLEIGKFDLFNDTNIGLNVLLKGASLYGIHIDKLFEDGNSDDTEALKQYIRDGIKSNVIRPLSYTSFKAEQLEEAFRYMAQGKHIGKVIIKIKGHENIPPTIKAYPRTHFDRHKSYIIIGGLGGMGFELTSWMIGRGATQFVLVSRTGLKSTYHEFHISRWEKEGIKIVVSKFESATLEGARHLLQQAANYAPIGGIFNTAVILKDALFENQSSQTFAESVMCKAHATLNLDRLSRELALGLDYFVVFSSISAGRGNPGQTNYGYANSVMERICEQRRRDGLHALAVQWGPVGDVGVLHRQIRVNKTELISGLLPQKIQSCLETIDFFLQQPKPVVSSFLAAEKQDTAEAHAKNSMVETVARILGIKDVSKVNPESSLADLGMDSLMSTELSQLLTSRGKLFIPPKWQSQLTFEKLAQLDKNDDVKEDNLESPQQRKFLKLKKTTVPVFKMKSICSTNLNLFVVHPLDGTMQTLETLIENLDINVYGIEAVAEAPKRSMETLAAFYIGKIQEVQPNGPYALAGYSFGCSVAFEMVHQLEQQNEIVRLLLLLDGSPAWKRNIERLAFPEEKMLEVENAVLFGMLELYTDANNSVRNELSQIKTTDMKWQFMASILKDSCPGFSPDEITSFTMSCKSRMECGNNYIVVDKIKAKTFLLKALQTGTAKSMAHDYGLIEVCDQPVEIVEVDGGHNCFYEKPLELGIPEIINNILREL